MGVRFKDEERVRLEGEWNGPKVCSAIKMIVTELGNFVATNYKRDIVITSIMRTAAENTALKAKSTTHVEGRAVDVSVIGWKPKEITAAVDYINAMFHIGAGMKPARFHDNGHGPHFHLQVAKDKKAQRIT